MAGRSNRGPIGAEELNALHENWWISPAAACRERGLLLAFEPVQAPKMPDGIRGTGRGG